MMTYNEMLVEAIKKRQEEIEKRREEIELLKMAVATYAELKAKEAYIRILLFDPEYYEQERVRATMEAREHA